MILEETGSGKMGSGDMGPGGIGPREICSGGIDCGVDVLYVKEIVPGEIGFRVDWLSGDWLCGNCLWGKSDLREDWTLRGLALGVVADSGELPLGITGPGEIGPGRLDSGGDCL